MNKRNLIVIVLFVLISGSVHSQESPIQTALRAARAHSKAGETDQAFVALNQLVGAGFRNVQLLKSDPDLAALRSDPRFEQILLAVQKNLTPCRFSNDFRSFDFWVGEWNVEANGRRAGTSSVQIILDECVLLENWTGADGYAGKSFNLYNPVIKKWQQLWVDNSGGVLLFTGEYDEGKLEYHGETPQSDGSVMKERLTFYRLPDKKVRQHWEQSTDGVTWRTVFDGLYTPK